MYSWWDIIQTSSENLLNGNVCIEFFTYTIAPIPSHIFRNSKVPFSVDKDKLGMYSAEHLQQLRM